MKLKLITPIRNVYFNNLLLAILAYLIEARTTRGTRLKVKLKRG